MTGAAFMKLGRAPTTCDDDGAAHTAGARRGSRAPRRGAGRSRTRGGDRPAVALARDARQPRAPRRRSSTGSSRIERIASAIACGFHRRGDPAGVLALEDPGHRRQVRAEHHRRSRRERLQELVRRRVALVERHRRQRHHRDVGRRDPVRQLVRMDGRQREVAALRSADPRHARRRVPARTRSPGSRATVSGTSSTASAISSSPTYGPSRPQNRQIRVESGSPRRSRIRFGADRRAPSHGSG